MLQTAQIAMPQTYAALRAAVDSVVIKGRRDIDQAWLLTYHETGRLINAHILVFRERADYGAQVFNRLASDTGISRRTLQECVQFARCFSNWRTCAKLGWGQCRLLCQVGDPGERQTLLRETVKQEWTVAQLTERVRALNALAAVTAGADALDGTDIGNRPKLLTPKRGTAGICKVIAVEGSPVVDLGFASYFDLPEDTDLQAGDFVQLHGADRITAAAEATKADLFTYAAVILKVVDGDTLWVKIYLRPKHWVKQKLRFRDLDCPEMSTPEGKVAKRFVDALVARTVSVTICTTKPDKYDRYLADVFLKLDDGTEVFLNNELLANGQAVIKRAWEFGDWGEV